MPAARISSTRIRSAVLVTPSRSTRVCKGRVRWVLPAAVMMAFLISTARSFVVVTSAPTVSKRCGAVNRSPRRPGVGLGRKHPSPGHTREPRRTLAGATPGITFSVSSRSCPSGWTRARRQGVESPASGARLAFAAAAGQGALAPVQHPSRRMALAGRGSALPKLSLGRVRRVSGEAPMRLRRFATEDRLPCRRRSRPGCGRR